MPSNVDRRSRSVGLEAHQKPHRVRLNVMWPRRRMTRLSRRPFDKVYPYTTSGAMTKTLIIECAKEVVGVGNESAQLLRSVECGGPG
jgi:hypothetical protein